MFDISLFGTKNLDSLTDKQLVDEVRNWNKQAFEKIYDRWSKRVYNYIRILLNYNDEDATAILSDVFIRLYDVMQTKEITNPKSFIYTIARNKSIDLIRSRKSTNGYEYNDEKLELEIDKNIWQDEEVNRKYKQELLQQYLSRLEEKYREVIHLYYYEEKNYNEIAKLIWSNKNTIWTLVFQAKKKLQSMMKQDDIQNLFI